MPLTRRTFLTTGGLAAVTLAICGGAWHLTHQEKPTGFVLTNDAATILDAIIPAILAGALTDQSRIAATRAKVNQAILTLPLSAQQEVQGLFKLLAIGPVRKLLAGLPADWSSATPERISAFLQSWRHHRLQDLQVAYAALHDLILGAWYADQSSWPAMGYPGPMEALS
ncbi:MAG: hypothetical protein ACJ8HI_02640 [Massilia sp.]